MPLSPILITDAAAQHIRHLLSLSEKPVAGLRISLKTKGCSGLAYDVSYAETINPLDEVVAGEDFKVLIEPGAMLHIIGSEMDYVEGQWKSGFEFRNPNEKGRCGCGESFHV